MALSNTTTNLLRSQYYDDYYAPTDNPDINRGTLFDFHRILFRPRYAVQSRELTQLQTLLQAQLERLGKAEFKDGDAVLGGQLTLDTSVVAGQVLAATNLVALFDRTNNVGKHIFDKIDDTVKAHVLQYVSADEGETSNNYLVFKYQSAATFSPGTVVQDANDALITATFASGVVNDVLHNASVISIDEGVYFISGLFVRVAPQTIVLNVFSDRPNFKIGLFLQEQVLDELDDVVGESLLDPANQGAPGAHRFRIKVTLAKRALDADPEPDFLELARVIDGQVLLSRVPSKYVRLNELLDLLARRTYDEAGDYVVSNFMPVLEGDADDEAIFRLALGPGKAYVRGYEILTSQTTKLSVRKGRDSEVANNRSIPLPVGNYVSVARVQASTPANYFANTATVDIHCVNVASIDSTSNTTYAYSKIGTAKVRNLELFSTPTDETLFANNTIHNLFFYDVQNDSITGNVAAATVNNAVAITLTLAVGAGLPAVNGAIEGVSVVLAGASSPVSGTFTVNNYVTANATHVFATLREFLPTLPTANTTYRLLFHTKDIDAFTVRDATITSIESPYAVKFGFQADVHPRSKVSGTPVGDTIVSDTNDNALLFLIPETFLKANTLSIDTAQWKSWVKTNANTRSFSGASNADYTLVVSGNTYSLPEGTLSAVVADEHFIVFDQTTDANGHGVTLQFSDAPVAGVPCLSNVTVTAFGSDYHIVFTYHFGSGTGTSRSLVGLAKTTIVGLPARTKTLIVGNTTHALANTAGAQDAGQVEFYSLNASAGFAMSLKTTDVLRVSKVLYKSSNAAFANSDIATATDVTSLFTLDTGQRDNTYEYAQLLVKPHASATIRPTGRLLVIFDWFEHAGRGYATVDSYLSNTNIALGMSYDEIPDYTSSRSQRTVNLRDVLDFRPARSTSDFSTTSLVYAANDSSSNSTYLTSTADSYLIPVSDDVWFGSYEYFLARIDKIALTFDGIFKVIEGQSAVSPTAPVTPDASLLLFQLNIPAYTLVDDNGKPTTVKLTTFDHKRYTMQDLSKIENRVAHLEYYTALNALERSTRETPILDADDNERFKNGILVDAFRGADVADVTRPDFTASIDPQQRELHTAFKHDVAQFATDVANSTTYGVTLIGDIAILSYDVQAFINQPLATHSVSVNPFAVAAWYGTLKLSPAVDIWRATDGHAAQVIDQGATTEGWHANNAAYLQWREWEHNWTGTDAATEREQFAPPGYGNAATFNAQSQSTTETAGNRQVGTAVVLGMRSRDIVFAGDALLPAANLFTFFDGEAVTSFVQNANVLKLAPTTNTYPLTMGQTVYIKKALTGTVATHAGNNSVTGTGSKFDFELVKGQLVRIEQGVQAFDAFASGAAFTNTVFELFTTNANNTYIPYPNGSPYTFANATVYTFTPVTIADVAARLSGNTILYTVKVVRAVRDVDVDGVVPYAVIAGSMRPEKQVLDSSNTTVGAALIIPASPRTFHETGSNLSFNVAITAAVCVSGVVRGWNANTAALRFDTDISDSAVGAGNVVHFVSGPDVLDVNAAAGQSATIVSYDPTTQTAILDNAGLVGIVPGKVVYSVGQLTSDPFTSNSNAAIGRAGTAAGCFHLQGGQFATGVRQLRLTDSSTNDISEATTAAEKDYVATGLGGSASTRASDTRRAGAQATSVSTQDTTTAGYNTQYVDPVAQTFLVDATQHPVGVFITSVDLCFAAKPTDDIPVIVEIRPVVNGFPSSNSILPCPAPEGLAVSTLRQDAVNVSTVPDITNTAKYTRFPLPTPVYLEPGREYAIVVRSDSNAYRVFTAELGAQVLGSDARVSRQPYAGAFFKSQNASAWNESPLEDLMFRVNRALWSGGAANAQQGVLIARAIPSMASPTHGRYFLGPPDRDNSRLSANNTANVVFDSYALYPHATAFSNVTDVSYALDVLPVNPDTGSDANGQVAIRYIVTPEKWSLLQVRSFMQGYNLDPENPMLMRPIPIGGVNPPAANTVEALITLKTEHPDVAPFIDIKKMNLLCVLHEINDMPLVANGIVIQNPGAGYLATLQTGLLTTTSGSPVVTGDANTNFTLHLSAGDTCVLGGNVEVLVSSVTNATSFVATANLAVTRAANTFHTYGDLGANNALDITITDGSGTDAAAYVTIGRDGKVDGAVVSDSGSGYIDVPTLTLAAPSACTGYTIAQTTAVLKYNTELDTQDGGNGLTRYMTRSVTLADGFDARDLHVTFDAYRPLGSHFYVYYKVMAADNATARFEDQPWRLMTQDTPDNVISTGYFQFKEFNYRTPNNRAFDSDTDTADKFKVFAIKIVMASDQTVDVPRIKNFRAIALDT
jgi:hypothetical protein